MAQYIALAASAFSIIGPALKKKDSAGKVAGGISINSSTSRSSVGFSTGLATGLALGIVVVTQFQKRRIKERLRSFFTWFNEDDNGDQKNDTLLPGPIPSSSLGEDSIIEVIANCNNSLTPNLFCSKITMKKGTVIVSQKTKGVEVYYILKGTAEFLLNDENEKILSGSESIVLNPWTTRRVENNTKDDLVMLRISDAGDEESENNGNIVVEKIDRQGTIETITNGIKSSMQMLGELRSRS